MSDEVSDITRLLLGDKEVILVGTAHISQRSVELVTTTIENEKPTSVCVELDEQRFQSMTKTSNWDSLDLKQIIRNKQTTFLVARLALSAFQKRMSSYTGVKPGAEMMAAVEVAQAHGIPVVLADRDIRTTLLRSWRMTPWWKRSSIAVLLIAGLFEKTEVSEDDLEKLRETHNISEALDEMGDILPSVKSVLVDERDLYMANEIANSPGNKVVVVIGAAHKAGIVRILSGNIDPEAVARTKELPEKTALSKVIPWILPLIIIGLFVAGFFYGDMEDFKRAALAWVLVNGVLAAVGAIVALAHPVTVVASFVSAPITSLNPTVGVGMVAALVQTYVASPTVADMERVGDDITHWSGWWKNRLSRILVIFVLTNLGSSLGTIIAFKWLADLI
ncbi:MAG: TraB/GumN family protein [bacterium]